jgi:hypothetical protein
MNLRARTVSIAFCLVLVFPAAASCLEPEYKFPEDKVLRYKYKSETKFSYKARKGKRNDLRYAEYVLEFKAGEYPGRERTLRVTFREIKVRVVDEEANYAFDSRKKYSLSAVEKNPVLGIFGAMPGEAFKMEISALGRVNRVSGFVDLFSRSASRGLTGTNVLKSIFRRALELILSDEDMVMEFGLAFIPFSHEISRGTEWDRKVEVDIGGGIGVVYAPHFKVTALKGGKASIAVSGTLGLTADGTPIPKDGSFKGAAAFDGKKGRLLYHKWKGFIKLPNVSLTESCELTFQKELDPVDVGPVSFEKPLRSILTLIERRIVKTSRGRPAPIFEKIDCEKIFFYACEGDVVRVVEKRESDKGPVIRVVTAIGREGWMREKDTEKCEVK